MPVHDELGIRMKEFYENRSKTSLIRRMPVAIRIDGRAFHTFTRGFKRPFDATLIRAMQETMQYLCENIQGCILGYCQSDEITLILKDYDTLNSSAWFDYDVQKLCSISASMATMAFNKAFSRGVDRYYSEHSSEDGYWADTEPEWQQWNVYKQAEEKGAMFDARCFNIPVEEVTNLIYWRQLDATRNSIQMVAQAELPNRALFGLNCNELQDKLLREKGINWNDFYPWLKRGSCCIRENLYGRWEIDRNIPIFKGEGREYIEKLLPAQGE